MNHHYNINDDHLREVLRVRLNTINAMNLPIIQPVAIKTTEPTEKLNLAEWFEHIKKELRAKDKFGLIEIK